MGAIVDAAVCNDKGHLRKNNEDNFYLNGQYLHAAALDDGACIDTTSDTNTQHYAICDGMGGTEAGEEAALYIVSRLNTMLTGIDPISDAHSICEALQEISDGIDCENAARHQKSGTTCVLFSIERTKARIFHVGDSRAYKVHRGAIEQLTQDHSEVARMVAMGAIPKESARTHPARNKISQYLGMASTEVRLSVAVTAAMDLEANDWFVLCSDGLNDMVTDAEICRIVCEAPCARTAATNLVRSALENGGKDNVTALCIRIQSIKPQSWIESLIKIFRKNSTGDKKV